MQRRILLGATLLFAIAGAACADEAASEDPATPQMQSVEVAGVQPGPSLWRISRGEHEMWILGTVTPVPKRMKWDSSDVASVIAESQLVLRPPTMGFKADIGFFAQLALIPKLLSARKNPGKQKLDELLPSSVYARWQQVAKRHLGSTRALDKRRPIFAAQALYEEALDDSGLKDNSGVLPLVEKAAKRAKVPLESPSVVVEVKDIKGLIADFSQDSLDDIACFEKTLTHVEQDLPVMRKLADAWAVGDIETLRATVVTDSYDACVRSLFESPKLAKYGLANLRERMRNAWLVAAEAALAKHRSTFAVLPMGQLLRPDGLAAELGKRGYLVEAPGQESAATEPAAASAEISAP
ncbi:MAG: TraB/GumN family protein [Xanthomonadales bacterium]|nr:TraB/GumN family protein [Xanthomonadales bacterium]MBK7144485.1 TraB/GumN family protein [Xanthomonadales bacterium]MCC6561322.1 TraB/GumN family protein [Xanthomonadales bacterium]